MSRIQLRRGDASEWTDANTVLAAGEVGLEMDTGKFKWGDGTTAWNDLDYIGGAFPGWSADDNVPANVSANGGTLALGGGEDDIDDDLILLGQQDVPGGGDRVFAKGTAADGTVSYAIYYQRDLLRTVMGLYRQGQWYFDTGLEFPEIVFSLKGTDGQTHDIADIWTGRKQASVTPAAFGSGAQIAFVAVEFGASSVTIELADPGSPGQAISVSVDEGAVTVNLATDGGGAITSTAVDVVNAISADEVASTMLNGTVLGDDGLVDALAETPLVEGLDSALAWGLLGNGGEFLFAIDEPADDTVLTSQRVQWYEDTVDGPKLRLKERDADGTLFERISAVLTSDGTAFAGVAKQTLDPATATAEDIATALIALGLAEAPG